MVKRKEVQPKYLHLYTREEKTKGEIWHSHGKSLSNNGKKS